MQLEAAIKDLVNAYYRCDLPKVWGSGSSAAADGTKYELAENSLLAEYSIRYGGYGGIAYHHVADSYIALFSHFIPCGVWEAIYILEGLLKNTSDIQPTTVHADTQGHTVTWTPASRRPALGGRQAHLSGRPERCRCGSTASSRRMVRSGLH